MNVIVTLNSLDRTAALPLTTVHCLLPIVTMEPVWMVLVPSPVIVTQDTQETFATLTSMNVKQLGVRMGNVKISLMPFIVRVTLDGLEFSVMQTLIIVLQPPLSLVHVMSLEQLPVLMVTPLTHASVWKAILVTTVLLPSILVIPILVKMAERAPTHQSLLLNVLVRREFQETRVV